MNYCADSTNSFLNYIDENKLFSFITSVTFAVIFIFIYILRVYTFFEKRKIPRAVLPTAPFGNIKDVLFQNLTIYEYLWRYYNRFKRKGYRYGGFYLFFKPGLLIVNPTLTANILSEKRLVDLYDGDNKIKDCALVSKLFSDETLNTFLTHSNDQQSNFVNNVKEECITTTLYNFFMETTCLAFGFKNSLEIVHTINFLLKEKSRSSFLHYFYLVYPSFKIRKSTSELEAYLKNVMEFRKKNDIRQEDVIQGFIDLLNEDVYTLKEAAGAFFEIFTDNILHAYSTVLFCLYELAVNEDIQQDVIGEIRRFKTENKQIDLKNLEQLVHLDLVVKETLRKYPPVPVIVKKCQKEYKDANLNLDVPKGTFIFVSIFGIQHDLENFVDPEKFDPDRFTEENLKFIKPNTYIPFGLNLKRDIGLRFTTIHIKLGLLNILSSFKVHLSSKRQLTFDSKKLSVCPEEPLPFSFTPLL